MRHLWNKGYRCVFNLGVYFKYWPAPVYYPLNKLGLRVSDFNKHVTKIATELQKKGFDAYIVGGCLRDLLSDKKIKPKDFDIVTSARPEQVKRCFARSRIIGRRFRLVHVPIKGDVVEVSTLRGQGSWLTFWRGARYQNNIYGNIEQDVWRRDFTANALYYDVKRGVVIDFTGGVSDIKAKKLVMIGDCANRFKEDPVRILRAVRFSAKTNFRMSQSMQEEITGKNRLLRHVSKDRLLLEVVKLFSQGHSKQSMASLLRFDCLGMLFSGFDRLSIKIEDYQDFWGDAFHEIDQRYYRNQRLSSSFLFAVLLWPIFASQKENLKKVTVYNYKKLIYRVLRFESHYVAIPKKLQEAIKDLWMLQLVFETRDTPFSPERTRQPRFQYGYDFFILRAKSNAALAEKALIWQSCKENKEKSR